LLKFVVNTTLLSGFGAEPAIEPNALKVKQDELGRELILSRKG
jgi:hypothetical protein